MRRMGALCGMGRRLATRKARAVAKRKAGAPAAGVPSSVASRPAHAWPLGGWWPSLGGAGLGLAGRLAGAAVRGLEVRVEGAPVPKGRPRATARGGRVRTYTPPETAAYEARVAEAARAAMRAYGWPTGGWRDPRVRYLVEVAVALPADRGDLDNYLKAAADAVNGLAFPDDQRVCGVLALRGIAGRAGPWAVEDEPHARLLVWAVGPAEVLGGGAP